MRRNVEKNDSENELKPREYYLLGYNSFQTLGWSYIAFLSLEHLIRHNGEQTLFQKVFFSLAFFQTLAILEVLHAMVGLVRSSTIITAFQVVSRVFMLWGVVVISVESQKCIGFVLLLAAWTITEVVRYSFYCTSILQCTPSFLVYLRYTLFIVLYPIGVTGELLSIYRALTPVWNNKVYSYLLPNLLNFHFNYYYFLLLVVLAYPLNFPKMYAHMRVQRKKVLGAAPHVKSQ